MYYIDDGKQRSLKLWWPLSRYYEKEECGENYGHWCNRREAWFDKRLQQIEQNNFKAKLLTYTEWKSNQRSPLPIHTFHAVIEVSSAELINTRVAR